MASQVTKPALILNGEWLNADTRLVSELIASGVEVVFRSIDDLAIEIGPACLRIRETVAGRDVGDFGLVQVMAYQRPTGTLLNALADYAAAKGVCAVNIAGIGAPTKLFKYVRLAGRGLSVPSTIYLPPRLLADAYADLAQRLDLPFVLKTVIGGRGRWTHLIGSEDVFVQRLGDTGHARVGFLAQELVPPDGSYLLLVLGGTVSLALRYPGAGDMLARSNWDEAILVDVAGIDQEVRRTAVRAATALEYEIAGVHLVRHWTTGRWCVLDVNPNPPIGSGRHPVDTVNAYSAYLKRRLVRPDHSLNGYSFGATRRD
jgi:glutathione synthase/RimK-type ligase-like ATP-grasp enzyme